MAAAIVSSPSDYIHTAMLATDTVNTSNPAILRKQVLHNEIHGLDIHATTLSDLLTVQPLPQHADVVRLLFFYRGSGSVEHAGKQYNIDDMALFITHPAHPLTVTSITSTLHALELHWHLTPVEVATFNPAASLPYIQPYATARTYKEAIKSEKTTSRTLLPPGLIPRLAIGSVQTEGPDAVTAHQHPMLEQLFMGVRGCDCIVECDGIAAPLLEGEVLHIPLGSMHGVRVEAGKLLEYLWFDAFLNQEDGDRWIATMHKDDPV